jgi:hypothetical protein
VPVVIALIVTPDGFPLADEVLAGNTSDKTNAARLPAPDQDPMRLKQIKAMSSIARSCSYTCTAFACMADGGPGIRGSSRLHRKAELPASREGFRS